ncbi:MAG: hypothetical protein PHZ27_05595 [Candidatus Omnitrophica bacterium]|nr:hypothetical protein [Candidatus Omnitrophota bacterium]
MKFIYILFTILFIGCSPLEFSRLLGTGTQTFKTKGKIYKETITADFDSCYILTKNLLNSHNITIVREDYVTGYIIANNFKHIFPQSTEATEVAFFFSEPDDNTTIIEISSLNYNLAEHVAKKTFDYIKNEIE